MSNFQPPADYRDREKMVLGLARVVDIEILESAERELVSLRAENAALKAALRDCRPFVDLFTVFPLRMNMAVPLVARIDALAPAESPVVTIPSAGMSAEQLAALGFGPDGAPR